MDACPFCSPPPKPLTLSEAIAARLTREDRPLAVFRNDREAIKAVAAEIEAGLALARTCLDSALSHAKHFEAADPATLAQLRAGRALLA